jgi:hypothetical protein
MRVSVEMSTGVPLATTAARYARLLPIPVDASATRCSPASMVLNIAVERRG